MWGRLPTPSHIMRILHLAFEDHRRPGSGGGSLRNREINARLASMGHDIDVVTANYAGARPRVEDGVHYRQCGLARGYAPSLLSHQMCLPRVVAAATRRGPAPDIIVEEFAPLTSSLGVGHWTRVPTVGVAQGFFAEEKAREYHLPRRPLVGIQRWGTRSHADLIAVSEDVAARLRAEAPAARVAVIANGVDTDAADAGRASVAAQPPGRRFLLFLGRLEIRQKGLDVLLAAMEQVNPDVNLVIAGEGKDRTEIERDIQARRLGARVQLVGAVHGERKWELLAGAALLLAPSRYETFGITPLEAMACGVPVVASDLACLRELIPATAGVHVPREDPHALAAAINALLAAPGRRAAMAAAGPETARHYSWQSIADAQCQIYASVAGRRTSWVGV